MPEGDTVHDAANRIRSVLAGRVPDALRTPHARFGRDRWPERLGGRAVQAVEAVEAHGKHLLLRFEGRIGQFRPGPGIDVSGVRTSLRTALRQGLKVKVRGAGTGRVSITALRGATRVGSGSAKAKNGAAVVRVRFTAKARRTLARQRKVALTLNVATSAPAAKRT